MRKVKGKVSKRFVFVDIPLVRIDSCSQLPTAAGKSGQLNPCEGPIGNPNKSVILLYQKKKILKSHLYKHTNVFPLAINFLLHISLFLLTVQACLCIVALT